MSTPRRHERDAAVGDDPTGGSSPVQREARALGDPTRHGLFRLIEGAADPTTVAALAEQLGLHVSAVRQHLAKLVEAGLVVEERRAAAGPGRPPVRYRAAPAVLGRWGTESPYERLALLLLEVARSGRAAREVGEEAGRLVTRRAVAADPAAEVSGSDPVHRLEAMAAQLGFQPHRVERAGGCSLVFGPCPYATAAAVDPMVCELHLGLAEGVAGEAGGMAVTRLQRRDPFEGGCRLDVSTNFDSKR